MEPAAASAPLAGESLLEIGRIRAVPSIHGRATFAAVAEAEVDAWRPGVVAVELPWFAQDEFVAAVAALPRIEAVVIEPREFETAEEAPVLGLIAVDPADSIVAVARRALVLGIPVRCVDVHAVERAFRCDPGTPDDELLARLGAVRDDPRVPDEELLEHLGIDEYYRLYLEKGSEGAPPSRASLRRERAMAWALADLATRYERVLFVGGMAHWQRIRARLSRRATAPPAEGARVRRSRFRAYRADVERHAIAPILLQWPSSAAEYDSRRPAAVQGWGARARASLLAASVPDGTAFPPPHQLARAGVLARRLAESRDRLTPTTADLLIAARGLAGDDCARRLCHAAAAYPQPGPAGGRPVVVAVPGGCEALRRMGGRILVSTGRADSSPEGERLAGVLDALGVSRAGRFRFRLGHSLFVTRREENEREDRMARRIVRELCSPRRTRERVREFGSGFRDGLDARRMLRDVLGPRRIFVRERVPVPRLDPATFAAVLIVYQDSGDDEDLDGGSFAKDCTHNGPKYWKFGTERLDRTAGDGWIRSDYGILAIVFETHRTTAEVHAIWHEEVAPAPLRIPVFAEVAFRHAPRDRPHVAYVASRPPGEAVRRAAQEHGRSLVYLHAAAAAGILEGVSGFHRKMDSSSPDAE